MLRHVAVFGWLPLLEGPGPLGCPSLADLGTNSWPGPDLQNNNGARVPSWTCSCHSKAMVFSLGFTSSKSAQVLSTQANSGIGIGRIIFFTMVFRIHRGFPVFVALRIPPVLALENSPLDDGLAGHRREWLPPV